MKEPSAERISSDPPDPNDLTFSVKEQSQYEVTANLDQNVICATEDRIELVLNEHLKKIEKKKEWIGPLGILITIIVTFVTAEFKNDVLLKKEVWEAVFIIGGLASLGWLIRSLYWTYEAKDTTVKSVIQKIAKKDKEKTKG